MIQFTGMFVCILLNNTVGKGRMLFSVYMNSFCTEIISFELLIIILPVTKCAE